VKPTSATEFVAAQSGSLPRLESVRDFVWTIPLAHPDKRLGYTLSYIVRDEYGDFHVIDPGWDSAENWASLSAALIEVGGQAAAVASITVTHLHSDHLGLASRLKEVSAAPVAMHRIEQAALDDLVDTQEARLAARAEELDRWGVASERRPELMAALMSGSSLAAGADVLLDDDQFLNIPGRSFQVIRTPGHTPGHICLRDADARLLFTGDHVLPTIFPGPGLGGPTDSNPIADYLGSLRAVAGFDDHEVCPGHEYRFLGLSERCADIIAHHRRRADEVASALAASPDSTIWELAAKISWSAGWAAMHGFFLHSALSQTAMYIDYVQSPRSSR
jgi:glyoxylase-like metal-dependent hydrolase (beta-lactamase superfamily II)